MRYEGAYRFDTALHFSLPYNVLYSAAALRSQLELTSWYYVRYVTKPTPVWRSCLRVPCPLAAFRSQLASISWWCGKTKGVLCALLPRSQLVRMYARGVTIGHGQYILQCIFMLQYLLRPHFEEIWLYLPRLVDLFVYYAPLLTRTGTISLTSVILFNTIPRASLSWPSILMDLLFLVVVSFVHRVELKDAALTSLCSRRCFDCTVEHRHRRFAARNIHRTPWACDVCMLDPCLVWWHYGLCFRLR